MFRGYAEAREIFHQMMSKYPLALVGHKGDHLEALIAMGLLPQKPLDLMVVQKTYGCEGRARRVFEASGLGDGYEAVFSSISAEGERAIGQLLDTGSETVIFMPFPNGSMVKFEGKALCTCITMSQFREIEDKITFLDIGRRVFPENLISSAVISRGNSHSFDDLCRSLNARGLVIQANLSAGGDGTYFAFNQSELNEALRALNSPELRVSRYQYGYETNGQAVVIDGMVYVDPPSHKPVGLVEIGGKQSGGCGNDWTNPFSDELLDKYTHIVVAIGRFLEEQYGYQGIFGVDSVFDMQNGEVWPHEINPRWQGTTSYQTANALLNERMPTEVIHYLAFFRPPNLHQFLPEPGEYNHFAVREKGCWYIKLANPYPGGIEIKENMSGNFIWDRNRLQDLNDGRSFLQVLLSGRGIALRGPNKGECLDRGLIPFGYIMGQGFSVFDKKNPCLTEQGRKLVEAVYGRFVAAL